MEASGGVDLASAPVGTRLMAASQIGCFPIPGCNKIELSGVLLDGLWTNSGKKAEKISRRKGKRKSKTTGLKRKEGWSRL